MNCWEYFKCGRQPGGELVDELGSCNAATTIFLLDSKIIPLDGKLQCDYLSFSRKKDTDLNQHPRHLLLKLYVQTIANS